MLKDVGSGVVAFNLHFGMRLLCGAQAIRQSNLIYTIHHQARTHLWWVRSSSNRLRLRLLQSCKDVYAMRTEERTEDIARPSLKTIKLERAPTEDFGVAGPKRNKHPNKETGESQLSKKN